MPFPKTPPAPLKANAFRFPSGKSAVLPNGIRLIVVENSALPLVGIKLGIMSGLTKDEHDKPGITEIMSEMLCKGTTSRTADEIAKATDYLGTEIKTVGGKDYCLLTASVLSEFFEEALDLIADMVINPTFPESELSKVLGLELASLANKRTQPQYQAQKVYSRVLFGDHLYGAYDTDEEILQSVAQDNLTSLHSNNFDPSLACLVLVGDIKMEKALDIAGDKFGSWKKPNKKAVFAPKLADAAKRRVCIVENPNAVQSNIYIGNLSIPYNHPDYIRLLVTNQVLGGSFASRLFMNLREQKSYTYGAYSRLNARVKAGSLVAYAAVRNEVTEGAINEFLYEFRRIREEKVSNDELNSAKNFITGSFPLQLETSIGVAEHIITQQIHNLPRDYWDKFRDHVNEVTPELVMETAKKYIQPDNSMICVVGKSAELIPVLSKYGKPEIFDKTGKPVSR
jgi:zinc protease